MEKRFSNIAIVHHVSTWSSLVEGELLQYLKDKANIIIYMTHPFKNVRDNHPLNSRIDKYERGKLTKTLNGPRSFGHEVNFFLKDLLFTLVYFLFQKEKIEIFFGVDNLNTFSGIILKKLGRVEKVVYYVIDYVPKRFENRLLNNIYHWVDFYCVKNADQTWNLSTGVGKARLKDGLPKKYLPKQIVVPIGCHISISKNKTDRDAINKRIVFLGALKKEQGVELLIECMPQIIKKVSRVKLIIIGSGEQAKFLKNKAKKLKIEGFIEFKGFVRDGKKVDKILTNCHLGVAPYILAKDSFKQFGDLGKIKIYLGAGLPIVMTNISHITKVIKEKRVGVITKDTKEDIAKSITRILTDNNLLEEYSQNAITLAKDYEWKAIFDSAFTSLKSRLIH